MTAASFSLATLSSHIGRELGPSRWLLVDQTRINAFAECTGDRQWPHVDADRARTESPYGTTIAHGYLSLSLTAALSIELGLIPDDAAMAFNYGLDRLRFLAPVKVGQRVRLQVRLIEATPKDSGVLIRTAQTLEIEGETRPALVAEMLALVIPRAA